LKDRQKKPALKGKNDTKARKSLKKKYTSQDPLPPERTETSIFDILGEGYGQTPINIRAHSRIHYRRTDTNPDTVLYRDLTGLFRTQNAE
jgi:repressor of nif and glnA expression